jgi:hypothetical protein
MKKLFLMAMGIAALAVFAMTAMAGGASAAKNS